MTKISEKCRNAVEHTNQAKKSEIQVQWTAPQTGSGCIVFRATVIVHPSVWFMDDGPLTKTFCEDDQSATDFQPLIMDPCCACDEAKYEVSQLKLIKFLKIKKQKRNKIILVNI